LIFFPNSQQNKATNIGEEIPYTFQIRTLTLFYQNVCTKASILYNLY